MCPDPEDPGTVIRFPQADDPGFASQVELDEVKNNSGTGQPAFVPATDCNTALRTSITNITTGIGGINALEILNTCRLIFDANYEEMFAEERLPATVKVDFCQDLDKMFSYSNVALDGAGGIRFLSTSSGTSKDSFDSITGWTEVKNPSKGAISLNTNMTYVHEGTGSMKVDTVDDSEYGLSKTLSPLQNWSTYGTVKFWVYNVTEGMTVRFKINGGGGGKESDWITIPLVGWNLITISIVGWNAGALAAVTSIMLNFKATKKIAHTVYVDDLRVFGTSLTYNTTANVVWSLPATTVNITYAFFYVNMAEPPAAVTYTYDISLDGGTNWRTDVAPKLFLDTGTGGVLETPDTGSWANRLNFRFRANFSSTDNTQTFIFDDIVMMVETT
jgi:hypothetical protein